MAWAKSPWAQSYAALWHTPLTLGIGGTTLGHNRLFRVNDALMATFFYIVGLEIKRELLVWELAQPLRAALPIVAAAGGVIVPALICTAFNAGGAGARGWSVSTAAEIAFVMAIVALLGDRVSLSLKVFRCDTGDDDPFAGGAGSIRFPGAWPDSTEPA